jgi:dihydrofolate reductase
MRKLTSNTFMTLDGVMQAPGAPEEDQSGGFEYGGWSVNFWDDMMGQVMGEFMGKSFDLLLGRKTYEIFAAFWPHAGDTPGADVLNSARKYVASRTLGTVDWNKSTLIKGDVPEEVAKLKEQDGPEIQIHGSGNLIQSLLSHGLIDECRVWIFPVAVGGGKRLFEIPAAFKLLDHKVSTTGVVMATYAYDGEPTVGTFASDQPSEEELARREKVAAEG